MAGMSVSGLSSGLDTQSIISQLMSVESQSQTLLKSRSTAEQKAVTALQSINTRLTSIMSMATRLVPSTSFGSTDGAAWTAMKATSSSDAVSVTSTSSSTAVAGSLSISVTQLAAAHSVATGGPVTADATVVPSGGQVTITRADGSTSSVTPGGSGTLADVASALNGDATLGVRAAVLQVEPGQYRLQVTSTTSGAAGAFTLDGLDAAGGRPVEVATGRDAVIDLGGGLTVTSATGTFTDVLPGTSFTVTKATYDTVTVGLAKDTSGSAAAAKALVDSVNVALSEMRSQTQTATGTSTTSGPLAGDSTVRGLVQNLLSAVSTGTSAAPAGIQLTRDGTLTFDEATFTKALTEDPAKVQSLVTDLASRLSAVAKAGSDPTTGSVTNAITGRQGTVKDLDDQVADWDVRLELRRATIEAQFSAMETALSQMNSQSSYLASQLAGLPSWGS